MKETLLQGLCIPAKQVGEGVGVGGDVDSDSASSTGRTKLIHYAATAGNLTILRLLLERNETLEQSDLDLLVFQNEKHQAAVLHHPA